MTLDDSAKIRKIQGTNERDWVRTLIFKRENGTEEGRIDVKQATLGTEEILESDEEIFGIYVNTRGVINSLSFLVWKPNTV